MQRTIPKRIYIAMTISLIVLVALIFQIHVSFSAPKVKASGFTYYGSGTNTAVLCKRSVPTLLATTTPGRVWFRISNLSATSMYISLGATSTAATSSGIFLNASSTFEMGQDQISYGGPISCLSDVNDATATITTIP